MTQGGHIALVVSGGGARGAYEAGALGVLLPELERRGERPTLYIGASVGALNAVVLASHHQLGAEAQVAMMLETWRSIELSSVIRPIVAQAPISAFFAAAQLLSLPGLRLRSLLDNSPLKANTEQWVDWRGLRSAIDDDGVVFCAVAMSARTGKTVVFVDTAEEEEAFHRSHSVAYVRTQTAMEHISASGALPVLWPPVLVENPSKARGWYFDGGLRTNAPIKPALDLGADRLIVLAVDSIAGPVLTSDLEARSEEEPDLSVGLVHLLEGTLTDPLINDMRRLGMINEYLAGDASLGSRLYRTIRGKPPFKRVPYIFSGPQERGTIGQLASEIYRARYGGLRWLRNPDYRLISGLLGGHGPTHGELLSLLFFDPDFIEALIELGADDARAWLEDEHDGDGPWQESSLTTFKRPRQWTAG
ncbi:MAG: patatin-like phospholipase family protein [Solirubrobacteraceae bacterium]